MAEVVRYVNTASSGGDGTTVGESGATAAYASMTAWEAAEQTNLVSAGDTHVVECTVGSGSAADDDAGNFIIAGWTTGVSNFITVRAYAGQEAGSVWDDTIYRKTLTTTGGTGANNRAFRTDQQYTVVENLQFKTIRQGTNQQSVVYLNASNCTIKDCFAWLAYDRTVADGAGGTGQCFTFTAANTIAVNLIATATDVNTGACKGALLYGTTNTNTLYNCTAGDCDGTFNTVGFNINSGPQTLKNCVSIAATGGSNNNLDFWDNSAVSVTLTNCASADGTAVTGGGFTATDCRINQTFTFTDAANQDYRLGFADAGAKEYGIDLSADATYSFSDDIDGTTRPVGSSWDIGASEALHPDAGNSTVAVSQATMLADGVDSTTVTVTALDTNSDAVIGATVVLAVTGTGNSITQPASTTDASGVATGSFTTTVGEVKTVSATAGGVAVTQTQNVTATSLDTPLVSANTLRTIVRKVADDFNLEGVKKYFQQLRWGF